MNFKEWLINEVSGIVKGPYLLYHATSTGENNERIESFKKEGAKPIGKGYGQGGGLFVFTKIESAKKHAVDIISLKSNVLSQNTEHKGKPMVVVIELPEIDFKEWDFDIEEHFGDILRYTSRKLEKMPNKSITFNLSDKSKKYLDDDKIKNIDDYDTIKKNTDVGSLEFGDKSIFDPTTSLPWEKRISTNDPKYNQSNMLDLAAWTAKTYYGYQDKSKDKHEKIEAWYFKKNYDNKNLALKYVGFNPLPVKEILIGDIPAKDKKQFKKSLGKNFSDRRMWSRYNYNSNLHNVILNWKKVSTTK